MARIDYASTSLGDEALDIAYETELAAIRDTTSPIEKNLIDGEWQESDSTVERWDPCVPGARAGAAYVATAADVEAAISAARGAAKAWRKTPYAERNEQLMRGRADFEAELTRIAAVVSAETGKTRLEAYGEAQEVLDMVEHYTTLFAANDGYRTQQKSTATETNLDVLVPYGTFAVIAPFNFPVALSVGMSIAALVTGNTIVLKPSDKTPRSTGMMAEIFARHLPAGVYNVVHGGPDVGRALAEGDVDGIAFTGSAQVGWDLNRMPGPRGLPRPVLAEMGGQNPAVVSAHADLEDAATGIVRSAFGLSGQKCSACRRVVVDERVADELISKLVQKAEALRVGNPEDRVSNLGPVIDEAIAARIDAALEKARRDGKVLTGGKVEREGNFYAPIIVSDLPVGHELTREELFAPLLSVTRVSDFEAAIAEANAVSYGLSAGVFSKDEEEIERFYDEIEAGVTYSNRAAGATTGAWPGAQSFAGWKLSGITGKGGLGQHYLQGFMREQNRTIVSAA
ncbi:aldehyde dehydrogenase family protein [Citricoccus sp.]|uniref:aldehyde dehydrogenase family protein n=1 Tax=Citricoccus sp. TaxID=1978372 RepID=UPI0028BE0CD9|nr:aldehyde dehydrogenase family protein [Citricoccus sp.]